MLKRALISILALTLALSSLHASTVDKCTWPEGRQYLPRLSAAVSEFHRVMEMSPSQAVEHMARLQQEAGGKLNETFYKELTPEQQDRLVAKLWEVEKHRHLPKIYKTLAPDEPQRVGKELYDAAIRDGIPVFFLLPDVQTTLNRTFPVQPKNGANSVERRLHRARVHYAIFRSELAKALRDGGIRADDLLWVPKGTGFNGFSLNPRKIKLGEGGTWKLLDASSDLDGLLMEVVGTRNAPLRKALADNGGSFFPHFPVYSEKMLGDAVGPFKRFKKRWESLTQREVTTGFAEDPLAFYQPAALEGDGFRLPVAAR